MSAPSKTNSLIEGNGTFQSFDNNFKETAAFEEPPPKPAEIGVSFIK